MWLDSEGQIVTTDRFPWVQEALRRIHPSLVLAWDNNPMECHGQPSPEWARCFAVCKMERSIRRLALSRTETLTHVQKVPVVMTKSMIWEAGERGRIISYPVKPSDFLLVRVGELEGKIRSENPDNWAMREADRIGKEREEMAEKEVDRNFQDLVEDGLSICGNGPTGSKVWTA